MGIGAVGDTCTFLLCCLSFHVVGGVSERFWFGCGFMGYG